MPIPHVALVAMLLAASPVPSTRAADAAAQSLPRAEYTVRVLDPEQPIATVTLEMSNLPADLAELEVSLPERFAFTTFEEAKVVDPWIVIVGDKPLSLPRAEPFVWRIPKSGVTVVSVVYEAPLTHRTWPEVDSSDDYEMPYLQADHGLLSCGALLAAPRLGDVEFRVRFELPDGWPVLCPWPQIAPGEYAPRREIDLQDALVAIGAWQSHSIEAGGARATVAFAPSEARLAVEVAPLVEKLFAEEVAIFGGASLDSYLFLFAPSTVRGFGGSVKQGSMVLAVGANLPASAVRPYASHLVAHEFFHTWGASRYACPDELRFLNEGFTDYFAYEATRRVGASSDEEFLATVGEKLASYERAAAATRASLCDAGGPRFFEGGAEYEQVYAGGLVVAALCEQALRARADKDRPVRLDDFLRALNNDPRWSIEGAAPTLDDFVATLATFTGDEFAAKIRELVRTPGADLASALVEAGCRVERTSTAASLELRANLDGTRLLDLDPECAVALVGLQPGDVLVKVNGVSVSTASECYAATPKLVDERLRIEFTRDGESMSIDAAPPKRERLRFAWKA